MPADMHSQARFCRRILPERPIADYSNSGQRLTLINKQIPRKDNPLMKKMTGVVVAIMLVSSFVVLAQNAPPGGQRGQQPPPQPMSFFIAVNSGVGANLGGLAGADRMCQMQAMEAGSNKTFHAYLST